VLLAIDIGNTEVTLGLFSGRRLVRSFRLSSETRRTPDEVALLLSQIFAGLPAAGSHDAVIASVVPVTTAAYVEAARRLTGRAPLEVSAGIDTGIVIEYRDPQSAGADRIANAVAALHFHGAPVIVVDFGTATTFDVIAKGGRYLGGVIVPGVVTAADQLIRRAARLPSFELKPPAHVVGRSTEESLQSGVFHGAVAQVDGIVRRIKREERIRPTVVATGGLAAVIAARSETIQKVAPDLTLHGLRLLHERNRPAAGRPKAQTPVPARPASKRANALPKRK
jgi:type III pantothenate kinase